MVQTASFCTIRLRMGFQGTPLLSMDEYTAEAVTAGLWLTRLWNGVSEWIAHNFCSLAEYPIVGLDTALHRLRFDVPQITLYKLVLDNGAHPVLWTQ